MIEKYGVDGEKDKFEKKAKKISKETGKLLEDVREELFNKKQKKGKK